MEVSSANDTFTKRIALITAPLISLIIILFFDLEPGNPEITRCFAIAILMAIWWVTEAIPLAATAMLPVALFPLLGVADGKTISAMYFNHLIFLFIGGFLLALSMQRWNLHKRIALIILLSIGVSPGRILLGFMLATAILSMWMSNTATAMMMVPIALSVILKLEEDIGKKNLGKYSIGLLLGIAYSASIGGIATLVGTPPNLSFARIINIVFPDAPEISFSSWFVFALPLSFLLFISCIILLNILYKPGKKWDNFNHETIKEEYKTLGKTSIEEKIVFLLFIILALLWIFRSGFEFGNLSIPGWADLFNTPAYINDGTVAIAISSLLFIIPSRSKKKERLLNWETASKIPWHIVILFGGGFALAKAFVESGLSMWFGEQLSTLSSVSPKILTMGIVASMSILTELTSNTATTEMILPILAGLSMSIKLNPLLLMVPATLAASLAFMLPVATPPNAIVFGTGHLRIVDMVKTGIILNVVAVILATLMMYYWGSFVFDIDVLEFPKWATGTIET